MKSDKRKRHKKGKVTNLEKPVENVKCGFLEKCKTLF